MQLNQLNLHVLWSIADVKGEWDYRDGYMCCTARMVIAFHFKILNQRSLVSIACIRGKGIRVGSYLWEKITRKKLYTVGFSQLFPK
jgi:hypothetical protein